MIVELCMSYVEGQVGKRPGRPSEDRQIGIDALLRPETLQMKSKKIVRSLIRKGFLAGCRGDEAAAEGAEGSWICVFRRRIETEAQLGRPSLLLAR